MSQRHDSEFTDRVSRLTFIVPPARLAPPGPELAYASDDAGLVQRITDSTGTHYCTASWPLDHDGDEDFEPRLREPTGFKWAPVMEDTSEPTFTSRATDGIARLADLLGVPDKAKELASAQATIVELEGRLERSRDYIDELSRRLEASTTRWTEWAAKILAAYPWVGEFHPEDGDDKYRDGVRYVLLCIESNGSSDPGIWTEMQAIKAKWGFS